MAKASHVINSSYAIRSSRGVIHHKSSTHQTSSVHDMFRAGFKKQRSPKPRGCTHPLRFGLRGQIWPSVTPIWFGRARSCRLSKRRLLKIVLLFSPSIVLHGMRFRGDSWRGSRRGSLSREGRFGRDAFVREFELCSGKCSSQGLGYTRTVGAKLSKIEFFGVIK